MSKGLSVRERAQAFFCRFGVASVAEMSEEDTQALATAEQTLQAERGAAYRPGGAGAAGTPAASDPAILAQMAAIRSRVSSSPHCRPRCGTDQAAAGATGYGRERENDAILMDMKRQGHLLPAAEEAAKKLLAADPTRLRRSCRTTAR